MTGNNQNDAKVGILMLDTRFPRIPGDVGHPASWPFEVLFKTVPAASPSLVVKDGARGLLPAFINAGLALVEDGAQGITTSCGFLSLFQDELTKALPVPVATSALMQVALINRTLPSGKHAGILTISGSSLTNAHLSAAGVPEGTPVGTTEEGRIFTRAILENASDFDITQARKDNVEAALALQTKHPNLGAIVLECTNMGPYAADIGAATGLPVYTIITFVRWFQMSLAPPSWP